MGLTWKNSTGSTITSANVGDEVTAVITFNDDDVVWVYIDWDDGEDNSLEKAIYQWERLKTDSNSIEINHIYTKTGNFSPKLRTVNSQGFLSKYFFSISSTTLPKPNEELEDSGSSDIVTLGIVDTTPIGINRVENKQVLSGIDNSIFREGPKSVLVYRPPIVSDADGAHLGDVTLEVTYLEAASSTDIADGSTASGVQTTSDKGSSLRLKTKTVISNANNNTYVNSATSGKVARIVEVKMIDVKLAGGTNAQVNTYNKMKIFLVAESEEDNKLYPITYVSNGDPIKKDGDRNVILDFTQSRTKASNTSISNYYVDNGKGFFQPSGQRWQATSATHLTDDTKTSISTENVAYTYMPRPDGLLGNATYKPFVSGGTSTFDSTAAEKAVSNQFPLNDFNQFYDQHHLSRVNVRTSGGVNGELNTFKFLYRLAPSVDSWTTTNVANMRIDTNSKTVDYTSGSYYNGSSQPVSILDWNTDDFKAYPGGGASRTATEYFVIADTKKVNKIFFNMSPYAKELNDVAAADSTPSGQNTIAGVYYLRTGTLVEGDQFTEFAEWVPVEFKDTTKVTREIRDAGNTKFVEYSDSFTKSGFIEFDMPDDWAKISASGNTSSMTGGIFKRTAQPGTEPANPYAKSITATFVSNNNGSGAPPNDGKINELSTTSLSGFTSNQIGRYQYTYEVTGATNSEGANNENFNNRVFWVDSFNSATNKLFLLEARGLPVSGSNVTAGNNLSGIMRKVNIYDIFDGPTKYNTKDDLNELGNPPDFTTSPYPHVYMWGTGANQVILNNTFNDVYPLKIVLTGSHFSASTTPGVELWDVLPFNNSSSEVITQKDNTAFDMSFMEITSNVSVAYAGTYYSAISKNGKVTIVRTGTPIQKISFAGNALGDESTFSFSETYESYNTLHKLRRMEAEGIRMMWDEQQKDGTYVRFFGVIEGVTETHQASGKKASKPYSFTMIVDSICLIDKAYKLMSDITPLGGVGDASTYT